MTVTRLLLVGLLLGYLLANPFKSRQTGPLTVLKVSQTANPLNEKLVSLLALSR